MKENVVNILEESNTFSEGSHQINKSKNSISQSYPIERRSKYFKIDDEKRRIIIFEVMVMNNSLKQVCQKHNINFSSAKNVIQIFKKEGRLEKKVQRARKTKNKNESKDDPDFSADEDEEEKSEINIKKDINKPSSSVLLQLQEDDSYILVSKKKISDDKKIELQDLHNQILTQSTWGSSSNKNSNQSQ